MWLNPKIAMYVTENISYFLASFLNLEIALNSHKHNFLVFFILFYTVCILVLLYKVSPISLSAKYCRHLKLSIHSFIYIHCLLAYDEVT